jgi:GT2 family glycosyltransferase
MARAARKIREVKFNLSILVISYNTRELTLACLKSIYAQTKEIKFEVIVVDNASNDGSVEAIAEKFPQVKLIAKTHNFGFAAANNIAADEARGDYLLLLNPDTVILHGAIQKLLYFAWKNLDAGIWGGRTLFGDGTLNRNSCWRRPTLWSTLCRGIGLSSIFRGTRWFDSETYGSWKRDSVREVDIVTGCFFLISARLWRELRGFDPAFFMYAEEADLCLRARKLGYRPMITPEATIIHHGGSSERAKGDKLVRQFRAKIQLFDRHWSRPSAKFAAAMMWFWVATRAAGWALLARKDNPKHQIQRQAWTEVFRRRHEWLGGDRAARAGRELNIAKLVENP